MATRRRSSAGAGRKRGGASARTTRNRDAREGRTTVACPSCGTEYRIPLDLLEEQIGCKSCGRAFVPGKASSRRIRNRNPAQPFILGGALLVFMVVGLVLISSRGGSDTGRRDVTPERQVETGYRNPRVRDVQDWHAALAAGNTFKLGTNSDISELSKLFEIGLIDGTESDREKMVIDKLLNDPKTELLRDCYVTSAEVSPDEAESEVGTVRLDLAINDDATSKWAQPTAVFDFRFRYRDGRGRVTGFEAIYEPPPRQRKDTNRGPRPSTHEIIGSAENVEREYGGKKEVVREAELKALPHLEGTSPEVQQKVDQAIATIIDIDGSGGAANRAALELRHLGKPAMPRLLNKLYELVVGSEDSLKDQDTVLRIRRVTGALEDLSGQRFGFNPSVLADAKTASQEYRLSSLKQWYGWWADNHWRDDWRFAIDQEENLFGETPDPKDRKKR